jgi:hypothetical protein
VEGVLAPKRDRLIARFAIQMTIELSNVVKLRKGWLSDVSVGPLNPIGVRYLNSSVNDVRLTHKQLLHIDKHGGITDFDIITIPFGLVKGMFIGEKKHPNHLIINYIFPDNYTRYKAVIKSAANGSELWLCTFHLTRPRQTKDLLKRGHVVKKHA